VILPVVLYECETLEHKVGLLYSGVLRMIFGLKREEVTGDGRELNN
jgi:hypothetical protein